ncbi:MAG TPA: haloacid dehalogenase [Cytophagales bacterium]|nr:haloacid dehalogenase [Cytophagales bacterium]HAA20850.1 haloacid dehalogenase [Cytophagales bacterium]HAP59138.1 haloacid dehalogenase [Cytophagales bacterium]
MLENIDAIIFDLGGVIINLDPMATAIEMGKVMGVSPNTLVDALHHDETFQQYEKGFISDQEFLLYLETFTPREVTHQDLTLAWNAMLLDIPPARIALLKRLTTNYRLFVLSNTNAIHIREFNQILQKDTGHTSLEAIGVFETVYFSYEVGRRKPDSEIFSYVVQDAGLDPTRSLFLDDGPANLEGAQSVGLQTQLVTQDRSILDLFA